MALIDTEGFGSSSNVTDLVNYGLIISEAGCSIVTSGGPLGDNYISCPANSFSQGSLYMRPLPNPSPGNYTTFFCGCRLTVGNINDTPGGNRNLSMGLLDASGNPQVTILFNGFSGIISAFSGTLSGTLLGTTAVSAIPSGTWFYFEVGATIGTTGSLTLKVNQTTVLTLPSVNTKGYASSSTVNIIGWTIGYGQGGFDLAHYYFCDNTGSSPWNTFLGDVRVQTLLPNGPGLTILTTNALTSSGSVLPFASTTGVVAGMLVTGPNIPNGTTVVSFTGTTVTLSQAITNPVSSGATIDFNYANFTPNGLATNWQNAASYPPAPSSDYNSDATVGATDLFAIPNMSSTDTIVLGVQVKSLMQKNDAGARTVATMLKSGTTLSQGNAVAPSIGPQYVRMIHQTDPNTNAQWSQTAVNAAQPGYTIVT